MLIFKSLFWFAISLAFALFEVENEGKYGWSEKSQTWYRKTFKFLLGEKPLTGYHIFIFISAILVSHAHFAMGVPWTWNNELLALANHFTWSPLWDYLWLIFNPHYGLRSLNANNIWWYHKTWWVGGIIPWENVSQWLIGIALATMAGNLVNHLWYVFTLVLLTIVSAFTLAPLYQTWNKNMHKKDDRNKSGIFH